MSKIESLTAEQESKLTEYRDKWINIGLSCEPCDFDRAKAGARLAYKSAGIKEPEFFYLFDSPFSAAIAALIIKSLPKVGGQVRGQVWDQVRNQVWDQVRDQVWGQVEDQVWGQVRDQVWGQVRDQVWGQVRDQVRDQVWGQVEDQVWGQVRDQVWGQVRDQVEGQVEGQVRDQVWGQVEDQVEDQVWGQVWGQVRDQVWDQVWGSHDAGWLSFYSFMEEVAKVNLNKRMQGLFEIAKSCGWWTPYSNCTIFQHRHSRLHLNEDGQLHCESGMACEYRDGFGVWAINGVRVDEQIVKSPESQTVNQIKSEENQEIKRVRIDRFGWPRYINEIGGKILDKSRNDIEATEEALIRADDMTVLVTTCKTGRLFSLEVDPSAETCEQAQSWLHSESRVDNLLGKTRVIGRT